MRSWDKVVTFAAAVSAPVLTLLADQHVISLGLSVDLGAVVAAAVGAYHLPSDSARQAMRKVKAAQQSAQNP